MEDTMIKVLLIEDDQIDQMAFKRLVKETNLPYNYVIAGSVADAKSILQNEVFDIVITDYSVGDGTAFDIFELIKNTAIIFVTGVGDEETAVKAMKTGAYDYLIKDLERNYLKVLPVTVENAIKHMKAEKQFKLLSHAIMSISDSVYITDMDDTILFVNDAFCKIYGYDEKEILGKKSSILCNEKLVVSDIKNVLLKTIDGNWTGEVINNKKDDSKFPVYLSRSVVKDEKDNGIAVISVTRDMTERVRAEEKIKASLNEKSILLKEIHHRVKNNMQVISSMLNLQSGYIVDENAFELFKESQNRVKSMALIHELLYQSENLARVNFAEYIHSLARFLFLSYDVGDKIDLKVNVENVRLGLDTAISCGLILNELISNCLKHAFPDGNKGEICVDLYAHNGKFTLIVKDNGVGFPHDLDFCQMESLGLQLVNSLTGQLSGSIELKSNGHGSEFNITFP